ncbi:hypothetical protein BDZ90DRAFT_232755 [Jaminaea rosea]|uniref:Uncharacterized protein n=1 Tax=Jaminaea rosea TaxID=1569628 RepID=A0A316UPH8_9BASI|nr:hypothetical protein BDZ90DRAFT_232755 [Jaminaea rosea]PWN27206.1 hypothetical protein BDZ90DRAFT_232755 [Jaminaea rosea]
MASRWTWRRSSLLLAWLIALLLPLLLVLKSYWAPLEHVRRLQPARRLPKLNQTIRALEWGQVQFLHTTDIHGHLAAHHSPLPPSTSFSADWADWVAFVELMRRKATEEGRDLVVVDTGDLVTGHGLSDATKPKGRVSNELVGMAGYDVLTIGNHELLDAEGFADLRERFVPQCNGRYLTSNVDFFDPKKGQWRPVGERWTSFLLPATRRRITALGLVFDFQPPVGNVSVLEPELTFRQEWLIELMASPEAQQTDIWLLAGHMPLDHDAEDHWDAVVAGLRAHIGPNKPIVALGGHTHVRDCRRYDKNSMLLQSGRFHETAGWLSLDWDGEEQPTFSRRYIDLNPLNLAHHLGKPLTSKLFATPKANAIRRLLRNAFSHLELDIVHGHAPRDYYLERYPASDTRSILNATTSALNHIFAQPPEQGKRLVVLNSGSLRSDLREGPFTTGDQYIVSPFSDSFWVVPRVPWRMARLLVEHLNGVATPSGGAEEVIHHRSEENDGSKQGALAEPGYVTQDRCGPGGDWSTDGDDAIHAPIPVVPFEPAYLSTATFTGEVEGEVIVDVITVRYLLPRVVDALRALDPAWSSAHHEPYVYHDEQGQEFKTRDLWKRYAERFWNGPEEGQQNDQWWKARWDELQRQAEAEGHELYEVDEGI